jgi:hypothetical protein
MVMWCDRSGIPWAGLRIWERRFVVFYALFCLRIDQAMIVQGCCFASDSSTQIAVNTGRQTVRKSDTFAGKSSKIAGR